MKRVVLFSGGLKSTYLATLARKEGETILLFFEHNSRERDAAVFIADVLSLPLSIKKCSVSTPLPLLRMLQYAITALPFARQYSCKVLYYGLDRDTRSVLIDPHSIEPFMKGLQTIFSLSQPMYDEKGFWQGTTELETPLRRLSGEHIIRLSGEWYTPIEYSWSCDREGLHHCGICQGCLRRRKAFLREKYTDDPTFYENDLPV